jgi:amino acid transporter
MAMPGCLARKLVRIGGINSVPTNSGTVTRTVPRAAMLALSAATLLYLSVQGVALGLLGPALASDKVAPLVREGKTQEQVVAAKPTADFDAKVQQPGTTGDRFVGQLYAELKK